MRARVFVTLKPSVFDPQGTDDRRRAALARLRRRRRRAAGQVLRARSRDDRARRRPSAGGRSRRQGARQPGDRELSHRSRLIMKFGIVVFPGSNCDEDALSRGERRARPGGRVPLAQGHRPEGRRRRDPAGRLRARRLPAHRRDGALLADHARRCGRSPSAAVRCSASATAFRFCSRRACCPARCCATSGLKYRCEHVHLRVEQTDTPFTGAARRRPGAAHSDRARRRQLLRAARHARAARSEPPGRCFATPIRRAASTTRRIRTDRCTRSPASATRRATSSA